MVMKGNNSRLACQPQGAATAAKGRRLPALPSVLPSAWVAAGLL